METQKCPNQHSSTAEDFCSECGLKMAIASPASQPSSQANCDAPSTATNPSNNQTPCPDCGTEPPGELGTFCENCGYNFTLGLSSAFCRESTSAPQPTQQPADVAPASDPPTPDSETLSSVKPSLTWQLGISVDASLWEPELSPPPPEHSSPQTITLATSQALIGRDNPSRAIHPAIAINLDSAISHRHALLKQQPDGSLLLRDLDSSNGTYRDDQALTPLLDIPLQSGDSFTLGHWTRITVNCC